MDGPGRPVKPGVAVVEDAAVGSHQPVTAAAGRGRHADDRLVEMDGPGRPVEPGVAVVEDAAVGSHQPIAAAVRGRRHADNGRVEVHAARRAVEARIAEAEDAAVGRHLPVALVARSGGQTHDGGIQVLAAHGSEEGLAEGEHPTVRGHQAVTRTRATVDGTPSWRAWPEFGSIISADSSTASNALAGTVLSSSISEIGQLSSAVPPKYQLEPLSARINRTAAWRGAPLGPGASSRRCRSWP